MDEPFDFTLIWGIGDDLCARLHRWGYETVEEFVCEDPRVLRAISPQRFSVPYLDKTLRSARGHVLREFNVIS